MAVDQIGTKGLVDCSVAAADIAPGTITNAKLAGSIANAKLANSSVTINGQSVSLGASSGVPPVQWQSVVVSDGSTVTTMVAGRGYFVNNTSAAGIVKLPASASAGDLISIKDYAGNFGTNNLTIQRNGHNIQGAANNSTIDTNRASVSLVYVDSTKGWLYTNESNVGDLGPAYVAATGGTVATSGDFKIHTFTGDSNFVVSDGGNSAGSNSVSYLVIAGGGGGQNQGGGGGAGGFREGRVSSPHFTASPLVTTGLPVSAQTYPVTVGGGGAGAASPNSYVGSTGSNSVFSTITSAGGGRGGNKCSSDANYHRGGSGGGGAGLYSPVSTPEAVRQGGTGNYPVVSPPQGNDGGDGRPAGSGYVRAAGGGGGAGAAGSNAPGDTVGGAGGAGSPTEITGSAVTRAGGGGGAANNSSGSGGAGGSGGGGAGGGGTSQPATCGTSGSTNTGGGGGGLGNDPGSAGSGGSGLVIIRYKFQN